VGLGVEERALWEGGTHGGGRGRVKETDKEKKEKNSPRVE